MPDTRLRPQSELTHGHSGLPRVSGASPAAASRTLRADLHGRRGVGVVSPAPWSALARPEGREPSAFTTGACSTAATTRSSRSASGPAASSGRPAFRSRCPVRRHPGTGDEGGRGLEVIDGLVSMYDGHRGYTDDDTGPGKTVYVVMSLIANEAGS